MQHNFRIPHLIFLEQKHDQCFVWCLFGVGDYDLMKMTKSYFAFNDEYEKVLTRTHDDALAGEKQDQHHGYV